MSRPLRWRPYVRWLPLLVLGPLLAGVLGYLVVRRMPSTYEATVTMFVQPASAAQAGGSPDTQAAQDLAQTYAEAIHTRRVLSEAAAQVGLGALSERELEAMVTARRVTNTQLLRVSVDDTDAQRAADFANAVAAVFVKQNTDLQAGQYASSRDNLAQLVSQLQSDVEARTAAINALQAQPASPERDAQIAQGQNSLDQLRTTYSNTLNSYEDLRVSEARATSTITVFDPAAAPEDPIKPSRLLATLLAALGGLIVAGAVVLLAEYFDDGLRDIRKIGAVTGVPVIGALPGGSSLNAGEYAGPDADRVMSLHLLRGRLMLAMHSRTVRSLMVTSAASGEGKSTTAANVAIALAQNYNNVILVDANLHRPAQTRLFGLANRPGLADLLQDDELSVAELLTATSIPNLQVLPAGQVPHEASRVLASARLPGILAQLAEVGEILVFDTPALLDQPDGVILSTQLDAVLFTVDAGRSKRGPTVRALDWLKSSSAQILGIVVNHARHDSIAYLTTDSSFMATAPEPVASPPRNGHVHATPPVPR